MEPTSAAFVLIATITLLPAPGPAGQPLEAKTMVQYRDADSSSDCSAQAQAWIANFNAKPRDGAIYSIVCLPKSRFLAHFGNPT